MSEGSCKGMIQEVRSIGGMIAFAPFQATLNQVKAVLMGLFDLGVVAFYCGHGPYLIRMLPPFGGMTEEHIDQVCDLLETALIDVSKKMPV
jgi:4-aminobutyrate aminotransferase-like enzyme